MFHHRLQQIIVWLPLSRVCNIVAAPHGWSEPDAFWPKKYWKGEYEDVLGKRSNKSLSNKTLADSFYYDQLLSCFLAAQSLHRRTLLKRHTHYHIYRHIQTELNNSKNKNSPNLITSTQHSTVHRLQEVICMTSTVKSPLSTPHKPSTPDTVWAWQ